MSQGLMADIRRQEAVAVARPKQMLRAVQCL